VNVMRQSYWGWREEVEEWWLAIVRAVPGKLGACLRARVYGRRLKSCGRNVVFQQHVIVQHPQSVEIGENVLINRYVQIQGSGGMTIGDDVMIGPCVLIWSVNHKSSDAACPMRSQGYVEEPVVIEDNVWLGAGCIVLPGVRIGRGSIIGAGAVVTKTIPAGVLAAGVPASVKRSRQTDIGTSHAL